MMDDSRHGASAPTMSHGEAWTRDAAPLESRSGAVPDQIRVGLTAVVLSVRSEQPVVLVTTPGAMKAQAGAQAGRWRLPSGKFSPLVEPSLELGLHRLVRESVGLELGFVEQLVTDYAPVTAGPANNDARELLISYLALVRADALGLGDGARWVDCYALFPWEDFRSGRPDILQSTILPRLEAWAKDADQNDAHVVTMGRDATHPVAAVDSLTPDAPMSRAERIAIAFGLAGKTWDDQKVVDRIDLIDEAGILPELPGSELCRAHRRLVAAGLGRLRGKIRYRPVVFELLPLEFTLFELQRTVEAVLGPTLHKQNFRRLVEGTGLVEPTGDMRNNTGGRPAKTFRFRREVLLERPAPGVHVRAGRAA